MYLSHFVVLVEFVASTTFAGTWVLLVCGLAAMCDATAAIVFDFD